MVQSNLLLVVVPCYNTCFWSHVCTVLGTDRERFFLFFSFLFWIFSVNNKQTWLNNPFCSFVVKGDATIVSIEMTQPRTQNYPVGIAIFKGVYPLDNIASRIVGGKPWHQNKYLAKLDGGGQTYLIMAQTFDKHLLGDFQIRILSDGAVDMLQGENSMSGGGGVVNIK